MKKFILIFLIFFAFIFYVFETRARAKSKVLAFVLKKLLSHDVPEISVRKAAASYSSYVFLDSRENEEYAVSHLRGAIFTGYKEFNPAVLKNIPKDKPIVVYCSIGKRSEDIAKKLISEGYKNVNNLYGGIFEWVNQGYKVYNSFNNETQNVHAYNHLWGRFLNKGNKVY